MKQKLRIYLAVALGIFLLASLGMAVWERNRNETKVEIQEKEQGQIEEKRQAILDNSEGEEFPSVPIKSGASLEEIIKQALYKKTPDWGNKNYYITVKVETNKENHAIGKFIYDGYNILKNGEKHHNTGEGIWFAAKSDNAWTLINISYVGYWGKCQDFEKFNFPKDLTPDCWDMERNILNYTTNPQRFYEGGLTKDDVNKIIQAFVVYAKKTKGSGSFVPESYLTKKLYAHINKKVGDYARGTILVGESQNISAPEFFAVKQNSQWIVIHNGQDYPFCSAIELYKFPYEIVNKCYDESLKETRENL